MKTLTSQEIIKFRVDGSTMLVIDDKGVTVTEAVALLVAERLGSLVTITEAEAIEPEKPETKPEDSSTENSGASPKDGEVDAPSGEAEAQ